ncbi:hypothetical protein K438DRAFT_1780276 [Mycena galopus ATCC 62051]|nr:hypothetical protein K438DRAFT_1780276 [Mycena galopus ATCC 62051]
MSAPLMIAMPTGALKCSTKLSSRIPIVSIIGFELPGIQPESRASRARRPDQESSGIGFFSTKLVSRAETTVLVDNCTQDLKTFWILKFATHIAAIQTTGSAALWLDQGPIPMAQDGHRQANNMMGRGGVRRPFLEGGECDRKWSTNGAENERQAGNEGEERGFIERCCEVALGRGLARERHARAEYSGGQKQTMRKREGG